MTHPPGGPHTPPPPSGPRDPKVSPLDPDSAIGRQVANDLSQVLAEIEMDIQRRGTTTQQAA